MKVSSFVLHLLALVALGQSQLHNDNPSNAGLRGASLRVVKNETRLYRRLPAVPPTQGWVQVENPNVLLTVKKKPIIPNIGFLFTGYNIMEGNPIDPSTKVDPGFTVQIFQPDINGYVKTLDGRLIHPPNVTVLQCEGCDLSAKTTIVNTADQYIKTLDTKVSAAVSFNVLGIVEGKFKNSNGYRETKDRMTTKREISMETEASCCLYRAETSAFALPPYSPNFQIAMNSLNAKEAELISAAEENPEARKLEGINITDFDYMIEEFVEEFGTHFVKKMNMGSLYGVQSFMSNETRKELEKKGIDIELSASISVGVDMGTQADPNATIEAGFESSFEYKKSSTIDKQFNEHVSKKSLYSRGSKPPANGNVNSWLADTKENPAPIKIELVRIDNLPGFSRGVKEIISGYLDSYCENMKRSLHFMGQCKENPLAAETGPFDALVSTTNMRQQSHLETHHYHKLTLSTSWGDEKVYAAEERTAFTGFAVRSYADGFVNALQRRWEEKSEYGVNTMRFSGEMDFVQTVEFESAGNDKYRAIDYVCPEGYAIASVKNDWHSRGVHSWKTGDWTWKFGCAKYAGVKISDYAVAASHIEVNQEWSEAFGNQDYNPWDFKCPRGHVLIGVKSVYLGGDEEAGFHMQRKWQFRCGYVHDAGATEGTSLTSYVADEHPKFYYVAATNALPVGFYSEFIPDPVDRRFKMVEYSFGEDMDVFAMGSISSSGPANVLEGILDHTCDEGHLMVGLWSNQIDTTTRDRVYGVLCSPATNIKLIGEARWSEDSTLENSYTFQCETDYVLIGVVSTFDAAKKDRIWRIHCMQYEFFG